MSYVSVWSCINIVAKLKSSVLHFEESSGKVANCSQRLRHCSGGFKCTICTHVRLWALLWALHLFLSWNLLTVCENTLDCMFRDVGGQKVANNNSEYWMFSFCQRACLLSYMCLAAGYIDCLLIHASANWFKGRVNQKNVLIHPSIPDRCTSFFSYTNK